MAMIERNRAKPGVVIGQSVSNHSIRAATGIDHTAGAVSAQSWFPDDLHPSRHSVVDGYAAVTRGQSVPVRATCAHPTQSRSEEHTSELQSLMRISYAVFCLKKKKKQKRNTSRKYQTKDK